MSMSQQRTFTCACGKKHDLFDKNHHLLTVQKKCGCGRTHSIGGGKITTEQKRSKK